MRHRLYYLLPDLSSARRTLDDLLLSRIEQRHVRFLTNGAPLPQDMPEANLFHKTDIVHGAEFGMMLGAALGMVLGFFLALVAFPGQVAEAPMVILSTLGGVIFGGWVSGMVAAAIPNSRLTAFYPELENGKVLMILDVPAGRIAELEDLLAQRHPEMRFGGEDPHVPVFP